MPFRVEWLFGFCGLIEFMCGYIMCNKRGVGGSKSKPSQDLCDGRENEDSFC